jgi:peroxiredoxin
MIIRSTAPRTGDPAPSFEVASLGGGTLSGTALRGRPALLVFLRHLR